MNARLAAPLALLPLLAPGARALAAPDAGAGAAPPARPAAAVLADFAQAVGAEAAAKHKSLHMKRELSIAAMGMSGTEERWAAAGDKLLAVMDIKGIGTIKQGSTGAVHWSEDPINGLRVLTGAEAEMARIESTWNADLRLAQLFKETRSVPVPKDAPKGAPLECVELVPKEGSTVTMCFDAATHLRAFQAGKQAGPQGEVPYTAIPTEWREIGGVKVPGLERLTTGPAVMELRLAELTFDGKIDPKVFRVPKAAAAAARAQGKPEPKPAPKPATKPTTKPSGAPE